MSISPHGAFLGFAHRAATEAEAVARALELHRSP